jgi:hypothetical protein
VLSNADEGFDLKREVEIDSRSKTDQAEDFSLLYGIPSLGITHNSACDKASNLNQENLETILCLKNESVLFIQEG